MTKKKILLIDEEYWSIEPIIDRIQNTFGKDTVVYCADGAEGLKMLLQYEFACIILDIMFPLGSFLETDENEGDSINSGLIILKRLRENLKCRIPVICFTIRDDDQAKSEIKKYDDSYHISKLNPRAIDILINQIRILIN